MSNARQLAEALGVGLASDLRPRPVASSPLPVASSRERWSPQVKQAFDKLSPHALVVVGTKGPVSVALFDEAGEITRRFGGNRGCWPLKLASSGAWKDTITTTYNRGPFFFTGALFRVWCASAEHEARLAMKVAELLGIYRERAFGVDLEAGFLDVGPEFDVAVLEAEVHALAKRLGITAWDDDDLVRELERRAARELGRA